MNEEIFKKNLLLTHSTLLEMKNLLKNSNNFEEDKVLSLELIIEKQIEEINFLKLENKYLEEKPQNIINLFNNNFNFFFEEQIKKINFLNQKLDQLYFKINNKLSFKIKELKNNNKYIKKKKEKESKDTFTKNDENDKIIYENNILNLILKEKELEKEFEINSHNLTQNQLKELENDYNKLFNENKINKNEYEILINNLKILLNCKNNNEIINEIKKLLKEKIEINKFKEEKQLIEFELKNEKDINKILNERINSLIIQLNSESKNQQNEIINDYNFLIKKNENLKFKKKKIKKELKLFKDKNLFIIENIQNRSNILINKMNLLLNKINNLNINKNLKLSPRNKPSNIKPPKF